MQSAEIVSDYLKRVKINAKIIKEIPQKNQPKEKIYEK